MGSPATEIAYITLKPGVNIEGSTPEAKVWQESLSIVAAQEGYKSAYYGRQLEDPSVLIFAIDWESRESHLNFIEAPAYDPFKKGLASIMEGVHLHHVRTEPPSVIGRAPVTEVATFFKAEDSFLENVEKFAKATEDGKPEGFYGAAYGKVIEKIVKHGDIAKDDTEKSNAVVLLIGWESKEVHLKFRDTALFKENIGLLREKNGGAEMFHVPFQTS